MIYLVSRDVVRHDVDGLAGELADLVAEIPDVACCRAVPGENFLENSLKLITEIDILQSGGIIVTERPAGKDLLFEIPGYSRSKDYKYSSTVITIFRKD